MRITRRISRPTRISAISATLLLGLAFVTTAVPVVGTVTAPPALAATSTNARGPSAAADEFNNQYVFWRGPTGSNNLMEAYYNAYTGTWNGPIDLGMGSLGSEPTVAVSDQVFAGPGGNEFNAQYVFWRGTDSNLWMAYWEGSWHGPILVSGSDNGIGKICSQPGATALASSAGLKIVIFWKGEGDSGASNTCANDTNGNDMWYAYSTGDNPTSGPDYFGALVDTNAGVPGSSPSVTNAAEACTIADPGGNGEGSCDDLAVIAWQGTGGAFWSEEWDVVDGEVTGPTEDTNAGTLGSPPSVAGYLTTSTDSNVFDIVWQGSGADHYLWIGHSVNGSYTSVSDLTNSGGLGSAPTIAEAPGYANLYTFWIGSGAEHDLWEEWWNAANGNWTVTNLGMGPLA